MNATKIELMALPLVLTLWPLAWAYAYWCIDTYWTWLTKQKPILSVTHTTTMRIYVLRSPLTRKWLFSLTVSPRVSLAPMGRFITLAIATAFLWACNNPNAVNCINAPGDACQIATDTSGTPIYLHPYACFTDSMVKKLEPYNLKIGNGNRCHWVDSLMTAQCAARDTDSIYVVDRTCKSFDVTPDYVSTVYVQDSLTEFKSCWHSWANDPARDSLRIEGRKYTVSNRSRYRVAEEPVTFGDVGAEGAVILIDERFYLDTKGDSLIVLNKCGASLE